MAAYAGTGLCAELVLYVQQRHLAVASEQVLEEFERALVKKLRLEKAQAAQWRSQVCEMAHCVPTPARPSKLCRDPKDDAILQAALAAGCEFLVTGDADLTCLKRVKQMPILTPRDFLEALGVEDAL